MSPRQIFVFASFLVLFALLISAPHSGLVAQSTPTSSLTLNISDPGGSLQEGDSVNFVVTVGNTAVNPLSHVTVYLPGFTDLTYTGAGSYALTGNLIKLGTLPAQATVQFPVTAVLSGLPRTNVTLLFTVRAVETGAARATTALSFTTPAAETAALSAGLTTPFADGQIRLDLSNSTLSSGSNEVQVQLQERHQLAVGDTGIILAFALTAVGTNGDLSSAVASGNIHLNINSLVDPSLLTSENLTLYTRPTVNDPWERAPFTIDAINGILTTTGKAFGEYLLMEEPEPWSLTYTPPGASAFSGSAQFSYPISVPPGVGGLTPGLSLNYNSRGVDRLEAPVMARGFGLGWGMPQMEITNGNASKFYDDEAEPNICPGFNTALFTLSINGASYKLLPKSPTIERHGEYLAIGDPSLKIEFRQEGVGGANVPNRTGEYWHVSQADGTTYTFGLYLNSEQVIAPLKELCATNGAQPRFSGLFAAASWKLDRITDKYGNTVNYSYTEACGTGNDVNGNSRNGYPIGDGNTACTEVDSAIDKIEYNDIGNGPLTEIDFEYDSTNTQTAGRYRFMTVGSLRPKEATIYFNGQVVSHYKFEYDVFHHRYTADANHFNLWFWWLTSITRFEDDDVESQPLPATTFVYEELKDRSCAPDEAAVLRCAYLLTQVDNGYGAVTKLQYDSHNQDGWSFYVSDIYTWDGVEQRYGNGDPAMVQTHYIRDLADACYDDDGSGCRAPGPPGEESEALVGFSDVTILTGPPDADGGEWPDPVLSKQTLTFDIGQNGDTYWLNGKTISATTYDPGTNQKLTEHWESWDWVDNPTYFARLDSTSDCSFDGSNFLGTKTTYTYDPVLQGGAQWGKATQTTTSTISGSTGDSCTVPGATTAVNTNVTKYLQLGNGPNDPLRLMVPWVTRLHEGGTPQEANLVARSFYLYDQSTDPDGQNLLLGQLTMVRTQASLDDIDPSPNRTAHLTVDTAYTYNNRGNIITTTTYDGYGELGIVGGNWSDATPPGRLTYTTTTYYQNNIYPTSVENPMGHTIATTYDATFPWLPASMTDVNNNRMTQYRYDTFGRLFKIIRPGDTVANPSVTYYYGDVPDGTGTTYMNPLMIQAAYKQNLQSAERTFYDGLGRAVQTRRLDVGIAGSSDTVVWQDTEYDALGRVICQTSPQSAASSLPHYQAADCHNTSYAPSRTEYDSLGRVLAAIAPDGSMTSNIYLIEPSSGFVTINTNPNGYRQASIADALGRLAAVHEYEDKAWVYEAELAPMLHQAGTDNGNGAWESPTVAEGSPHHLTYGPYAAPDAIGPGQVALFRLVIDVADAPNDAVAELDVFHNGTNTVLAERILYRHEFKGGMGNFSDFALQFDTTGFSGANLEYRVYWLDKARMAHDHTRILWQHNVAETQYDYDTQGNLISVLDADENQTVITYDALGRKTSMTDPDMGYWTYEYGPAGNLIRQIANPGGEQQILCFEYDALNRLEQKGVGDTSDPCNISDTLASYEYDPTNGVGQLHTVSWGPDPNSNRDEFFYDNLGRMDKQSRWLDGTRYDVITTSFDPLHRPLTVQYPDGETVTLTYDREGENSLKLGASTFLVDNITYNARGQMMTLSRPGSSFDTTFSYYLATGSAGNSNFRLETIQHGTSSDTLPDFTYQYDPVGNVTNLDTAVSGSTEYQHFAYDHLNRLDIACTWTGSACHATPNLSAGQYNHNYNYNVLGNISQRIEKDGGTTTTYTYNYGAKPHAVTSVTGGPQPQTFTYDDNGNMETRLDASGDFAQGFDIENRLVQVTDNVTGDITQFFYDASGQRVKTVQPDGDIIYTPFPNYEVEERQPVWQTLPPPAVTLSTPNDGDWSLDTPNDGDWSLDTADTANWPLHTGDDPGWGLSLSQGTSWATNLLPVAVDDLAAAADADFPATSLYTGSGVGAPHIPGGQPFAVNNLANGYAQSQDITLAPGREYRLRVWVKGNFSGASYIRAIPYGLSGQAISVWSSTSPAFPVNQTWQEVNVTFVMPAIMPPDPASRLELVVEQMNGWVAFDNLRLYEMNDGKAAYGSEGTGETLIYSNGFENAPDWTPLPDGAFPGTSIWRGSSGPAAPQSGAYSLVLSNLGQGTALTSPTVSLAGSGLLHFGLEVQRDLKNTLNNNEDGVALVVNYYNNSTPVISRQIWHSDQLSNSSAWQSILVTDTPPPNANNIVLSLVGSFYDGWHAFDDVQVEQGPTLETSTLLAFWDFETPTWTAQSGNDFPAGTVWHGPVNTLGLPGHVPDYGQVYAFTNRARAEAFSSTWFDVTPFQSYQIGAWVRGQFASVVSSHKLWLEYYNGSNFVERIPMELETGLDVTTWQPVSQNITVPAYADRFRLVVVAERLGGWLALDDISVLDQTQPAPWHTGNSWSISTNPALPAASTANESEIGTPQAGIGRAMALHNLANGRLEHSGIMLLPDETYTLRFWVRNGLAAGKVAIEMLPFSNGANPLPIWAAVGNDNNNWQQVTATFTMPPDQLTVPSTLRILTDRPIDGWIAFDKVEIYVGTSGTGDPIFSDGFEDAHSWVVTPDIDNHPATAMQRTGQGPAAPVEGNSSFLIGNAGGVSLVSPRIELRSEPNLSTSFWANIQLQDGVNGSQVALVARYFTESGTLLPEEELWSTTDSSNGWQEVVVLHQTPATAIEVELHLRGQFFRGWLAMDNLAVEDVDHGLLVSWDFNTPPESQGWSVQQDRDYPAGTGYWGDDLGHWSAPETPEPTGGFLLTNEGGGQAQTGLFPATEGETYHLRSYVRGQMAAPTPVRLRLYFYKEEALHEQRTLWSAAQLDSSFGAIWPAVDATFTISPGVTAFQIVLEAERLGGWLALDGARLATLSQPIPVQAGQDYELSALIAGETEAAGQASAALTAVYYDAAGAEINTATVWGGVDYSQSPPALQSGSFSTPPGTASLRVGLAASVDDDVADGWLLFNRVALTALSQPIPIVPGQPYDLSANVQGALDGPAGQVSGQVAAHFYDSQGNLLAVDPIWQATDYNQPTAPQTQSGSASHAAATQMRLGLMTVLDEGWLAFDTVKLSTLSQPIPADGSQEFHLAAQLAGELNSASGARLFVKYSNGNTIKIWWNEAPFNGSQTVGDTFTPPAGTFQVGTEVVLDKGNLAFTNLTLSALSAAIPHSGPQTYSLAAGVNGVLDSANGGRLFVRYNTGTMIDVWQNTAAFSGGQTVSGNFTPASGVSSFQVGTEVGLDKGHLTFSDVTLTAMSATITARPGQLHDLFAQVNGYLNSANGGRLFVKYSNGTIGYEWRNAGIFNGSQNVSGSFTTPTGVSSFQVGTEVVLDKGYLAFSSVVLRAFSEPIAVTAGDEYQFDGQVAGALVAPVAQGGQIVARYSNAAGGDAGYDVLWDNPANFNGTAQVQQSFNANPGATTMRLMLITNLDAGHLTYSNFGLQHMVTGYSTIQRTTYSVAGQSIAVKVSGDPEGGNNGIFYTYSDHLGSASAMRHPNGSVTQTKYLPFGGYRGGSGGNPITDRGYTGHKHNDSLGLIYMNARYYSPTLNRFLSADTIVPDPANPQSFNRYSYVLNNSVNSIDPTGHRECNIADPLDCNNPEPNPRPTPPEIRDGVPDLIQNITTLFSTLPFDPTAYTGGLVQGFGDTTLSSERRDYRLFGYTHPGVDIPLPGKTENEPGTALLGLGDGYVTCGSEETHCGQQPDPTGSGHGIGIYYYSCDCVVYYSHALNVLPEFTNGETTKVSAGMVVGYVGASTDGYVHLHLEIRNLANTMVYNPIYFFEPATWDSMGLKYQGYQNGYANPESRVYAITMSTGLDYWNWNPWSENSRPFVFVR